MYEINDRRRRTRRERDASPNHMTRLEQLGVSAVAAACLAFAFVQIATQIWQWNIVVALVLGVWIFPNGAVLILLAMNLLPRKSVRRASYAQALQQMQNENQITDAEYDMLIRLGPGVW